MFIFMPGACLIGFFAFIFSNDSKHGKQNLSIIYTTSGG